MPNRRSRNPQGHRKPKTVEAAEPVAPVVPLKAVPAVHVPEPPCELTPAATEVWEDFWHGQTSKIVDVSDHFALRRWIEAVDEREGLIGPVRENPTVDGSQGQPVINPLAKRLAELETRIERTEIQFGMTPKARADLGVAAGTAAMTAEQLNKMAQEGPSGDQDGDGKTLEGEAEEIPEGFENA